MEDKEQASCEVMVNGFLWGLAACVNEVEQEFVSRRYGPRGVFAALSVMPWPVSVDPPLLLPVVPCHVAILDDVCASSKE